jgi:S-methylmethionine-dependent homocysteine/selenocysteine methylase
MSRSLREILNERLFVTNAGTETYLVFQQGFELPEFCAFAVFEDEAAWSALVRDYLHPILDAAAEAGHGLLLDALTWRAQPDFLERLGHPRDALLPIHERAVARHREAVAAWRERSGVAPETLPVLVAADVGPRGDGYRIEGEAITAESARGYHRAQLEAAAEAGVDLACALTMTGLAESIGIVHAAIDCGLPIVVSPTVETDGRLPDGTALGTFVEQVDRATDAAPEFYMVNCAHPDHVVPALEAARAADAAWLGRFRGLRANASRKSHAELDESTELDRGDVAALARHMAELRDTFDLAVVGGCCGTDHEHLAAMAADTAR